MPEGSTSDAASSDFPSVTLLARLILAEVPIQAILDRIVEAAAATIAPVSTASISLKMNDGYETPAATAGEAVAIDAGQYREDAGPCVEAAATGEWCNVGDIAQTADRWPSFAAEAAAHDVQSSLSVPLTVGNTTFGALNLYSHELNGFGHAEEQTARDLAAQASATIANAQAYAAATTLNEQLQEALRSREMIGRAVGILMARERCDAEAAFDLLRSTSQHSNRKLRDLAQEINDVVGRVKK